MSSHVPARLSGIVLASVLWLARIAPAAAAAPLPQAPQQPAGGQAVAVGVLAFGNEAGRALPAPLAEHLTAALQRQLVTGFKDIIARRVGAGAAADLSVEQLVALGRQAGVKFVLRPAVLAYAETSAADDRTVTLQVFADVLAVENGAVTSMRAESSASEKGGAAGAASVPVAIDSLGFAASATGRACAGAIALLAASIHDAVVPSPAASQAGTGGLGAPPPGVSPPDAAPAGVVPPPDASSGDVPPPLTDLSQQAQVTEELQQLIAQAEATLSSGIGSQESTNALLDALTRLQGALDAKARALAEGRDAPDADREILLRRDGLRAAIDAVQQDINAGVSQTPAPSSSQGRGAVSSLQDSMATATSLLQRIQELRAQWAALRGEAAPGQGPAPGQPPSPSGSGGVPGSPPPAEEALALIVGTVTVGGQPVQGAVVADADSGVSTQTDAAGAYTLQGMPPKLATLVVTRGGQEAARGSVQVVAGRVSVADFALSSGNTVGQTVVTPGAMPGTSSGRAPGAAFGSLPALRVLPSTATVAALRGARETGTVRGQVLGLTGLPAARALVMLQGASSVRTDSQGRYAFYKVPPGNYQLTVNTAGLAPRSLAVRVVAAGAVDTRTVFVERDRLALPAETLVVAAGSTVQPATLRGLVLDAGRAPIANASVTLAGSTRGLTARTDGRGQFELRGLAPGGYRVYVTKVEYATGSGSVTLKAGKTSDARFELKRTAPAVNPAMMGVARTSLRDVSGVVQGTDRAPVPAARVDVYRAGAAAVMDRLTTDRRGRFAVRLLPGDYEFRAGRAGYGDVTRKITIGGGQPPAVEIVLPTRPVQLAAPGSTAPAKTEPPRLSTPPAIRPAPALPPGQLSGIVVGGSSRKAVRDAAVSIGDLTARTDANGRFAIGQIRPGTYRVTIRKTGFFEENRQVTINAGQTTSLTLQLAEARMLIK